MSSKVGQKPQLPDSVMAMFSLKGKVASVTGGAGGIGYEVAKAFAEAGANVAIWYNSSKSAIDKAAALEKQYGIKAKAYQAQVTDNAAVQKTVRQIESDFGRLDVMVVNHGIPAQASLLDQTIDEMENIINVDLKGALYVARETGLIFKKQQSGSLIFTASMSGHIANVPQLQASYNLSKAALIHAARSLAVEWAQFNARVNSVSPGYIGTEISNFVPKDIQAKWHELTPMRRDADPRELKGAYLYFASDASTFTTGSDLLVDGGYCAQ